MTDGSGTDREDPGVTRRRFLTLAGTGTVTILAGCGGGSGDGSTDPRGTDGTEGSTPTRTRTATETATSDPTPTTTEEPFDWDPDFEAYPYGIGESKVDRAREVMRDAGYGPDDEYELEWLYLSPRWDRVAETLRERASEAFLRIDNSHVPMTNLADLASGGGAFPFARISFPPDPRTVLREVDPRDSQRDPEGEGIPCSGRRIPAMARAGRSSSTLWTEFATGRATRRRPRRPGPTPTGRSSGDCGVTSR